MPYTVPSRSDVHVNRPLTNISIAFIQSAASFVAMQAFPNIPVQKQSDRYFTYDRGDWNRDTMQKRAPGTESAGGSYKIDSTPNYFAEEWALHKDVPDRVRENADQPINPDRDATNWLTTQALLRREIDFASRFFIPATWTNDVDGVSGAPGAGEVRQWSDYTNSTPVENIRAAGTAIQQSTGFRPNKLIIGRQVYDQLIDHPDIIGRLDRGQTSGPARANRESLAAIFELDQILVMEAIQNTAAEGVSNVHSFIGGKRALLVYSAPTPGIQVPSAGYNFSWTAASGSGPAGSRIFKFRMDHLRADRVEIEMNFDQKLVSADLGYFFDTIVA